MAGWFTIDPNKLKELAANTLINAQKQIGRVTKNNYEYPVFQSEL